jgi:hypothetical protein
MIMSTCSPLLRSRRPMAESLDRLTALGRTGADRALLTAALRELDARHELGAKIALEPNLAPIVAQFISRLLRSYGSLAAVGGQRVLDIASGSHSSRSPVTGRRTVEFEPWMCRLLAALGADPVGIDIGDLETETFEHYRIDLGVPGALGFLPGASFDAIHESRLFGSPEFRSTYAEAAELIRDEIQRQERRLLRPEGILIHSDEWPLSRRRALPARARGPRGWRTSGR